MAKARFTFTVIKEYEMKPDYYPDCSTPSEMLKVDIDNANEDPYLFIGDNCEWEIKAELIPEKIC
jgi:hypothetical protein